MKLVRKYKEFYTQRGAYTSQNIKNSIHKDKFN